MKRPLAQALAVSTIVGGTVLAATPAVAADLYTSGRGTTPNACWANRAYTISQIQAMGNVVRTATNCVYIGSTRSWHYTVYHYQPRSRG